jgi:asparagine synthase (glutamine-hydrolysing)
MSIIFGAVKSEDDTISEEELSDLAQVTGKYALNGTYIHASGRVGMGFQPQLTNQRSWRESQPVLDPSLNLLTFDGRLDNYKELSGLLAIDGNEVPDSSIVLAAFHRWGCDCFARLVGDWALALWSRTEGALYLARDHAGSRSLYFEKADGVILWSTYLDTFLAHKPSRSLDETYVAHHLACRGTGDLTPFSGIAAVTPAHYIAFKKAQVASRRYWSPITGEKLNYKSDGEYEEHFIALFRQSVDRRTGSGSPILAELSGGMDSTSIVCVSDLLRREQGGGSDDLVDTVSYFDDTEPTWNEKPYFSLVEKRRGKVGVHIETSFCDRTFAPVEPTEGPYLIPGCDSGSLRQEDVYGKLANVPFHATLISGVGGDELLGGLPTPFPELADYLIAGELKRFCERSVEWSLSMRLPVLHTSARALCFIVSAYAPIQTDQPSCGSWISKRIVKRTRSMDELVPVGLLAVPPGAIYRGTIWQNLIATLPHLTPTLLFRQEYRYPYLDRDLVDFLLRTPHEQLVRPGRRRSLMRRALAGVVPSEIVERRQKAYLARRPLLVLKRARSDIERLFRDSLAAEQGFIDPRLFLKALDGVVTGGDSRQSFALMKTIGFEIWLRSVEKHSIFGRPSRRLVPTF